jgi:hypothetical protein
MGATAKTTARRAISIGIATLIAVAVSGHALIATASAASKGVSFWIGSSGTVGGQLSLSGGAADRIAIHRATGDLYVVDVRNHRVQRFSSDGDFELAWGQDVVVDGGGGDTPDDRAELCAVAQECKAGSSDAHDHGGEFSSEVTAVAVDQSDDSVYVVDGARIQKFDADGAFVLAWGRGVGATNEVQVVSRMITGAEGFQDFTLTYEGETTAPISENASPADMRRELTELPNIGNADVVVQGPPQDGPWRIEFTADRGGADQPQLSATPLSAAITVDVTTTVEGAGSPSPDVCTEALACEQGSPGTLGGHWASAPGVAVAPPDAPNAGNVVLADHLNARVQEFDPDGGFVRAFGWDVVQEGTSGDTAADEFEICTVAAECKAGSTGGEVGQLTRAMRVAADSTGAIYVVDQDHPFGSTGGQRVQKYTPQVGPPALEPSLFAPARLESSSEVSNDFDGPGDIAIGDEDHVFVTKGTAGNFTGVEELIELTPAGVEFADSPHLHNPGMIQARGLAVDTVLDRLYIGSAQPESRVYVVATDSGPPTASIEPAAEIGAHTAELSGLVNPSGPGLPDGVRTRFRFEYRPAGGGQWLPAHGAVTLADNGTDPIAVSRTVTGLEADTPYEARLVALKEFFAPVASSPVSFSTAVSPPDVFAVPPADRGETIATLAAWINPNNSPTTYRFEYGETDSYGGTVPVPDEALGAGGILMPVSEPIVDLEPETTYHFRVVAENAHGATASPDRTFTTRSGDAGPERAYEMVTPPFKVMRAAVSGGGPPGFNANPGAPSLDGESVLWHIEVFPLADDVAAPFEGDRRIISRTSAGWQSRTLLTQPALGLSSRLTASNGHAAGGDLSVFAWRIGTGGAKEGALLETPGAEPLRFYTRRDGTGANGFTGWIANTDTQVADLGLEQATNDAAFFTDDGSWMARWGHYRGLAEDPGTVGDDDPSDEGQLFGQAGGSTAYLQGNPPHGELDMIGECTGSEGGSGPVGLPSVLPARVGSGAVTDAIGMRECTEGSLTSARGAAVGGNSGDGAFSGPSATAMSEDGRRVYFMSPDPSADGAPASCAATTGAASDCPPQLFVRQYDSEGNPIVRWISRARGVGTQRIGELAAAGFQGASRDGRHVYFYTRSPLLPDDPNGGISITDGIASPSSTDLYRYTLPAGLDADPDEGTLERISGGPGGDADPSASPITQGPARFISDDGKRAYFVTEAPIPGADAIPPAGGATAPGGTVGEDATRNLYLFDDTGEAPEWRFIARIPYSIETSQLSVDPAALDTCASSRSIPGATGAYHGYSIGTGIGFAPGYSCVRGTPGGEAIIFSTRGQLAPSDNDEAADIYLYDARTDELERVTEVQTAGPPYSCYTENSTTPTAATCWGDFGFTGVAMPGSLDLVRGWGGGRTYNMAIDSEGVVSVYFESRSSLVSEDTNGDHYDVYEWREGELSLISPGDTDDHSWYSGNSEDGQDVFIFTSARIDPREIDDSDYDIYDARIGGGFPYTPPPEPCDVLGLQCEDEAEEAPALAAPVTGAPLAQGNVPPKRNCARLAKRTKKLSSAAKHARRLRRVRTRGRPARMLNRRARALSKRASRSARKTKACRRANRRALR